MAIDEVEESYHFRGAETQRSDWVALNERGVRGVRGVQWKSASEELERRGRLEEPLKRDEAA